MQRPYCEARRQLFNLQSMLHAIRYSNATAPVCCGYQADFIEPFSNFQRRQQRSIVLWNAAWPFDHMLKNGFSFTRRKRT
ncbi:MAG: hypothetical protein R3B47_02350 [Bacteroidia bacterium]